MKKKVLHIVEAFGGGIFTFLVDLVNNTSDKYDITIAYSCRNQTPSNFKEYFNNNVKFIEVENFTRSIKIKNDIKAFKEVRKIVKEINPDIVHLHSSKAGVIGRLAVSGRKTKMFYNPHGFSFLKQDDSKLKRTIYWTIEKMMAVLNKKCTIVGCSNGEYEEAKKLNKNSVCINNGIDIEKLNSKTEELEQNEIDLNNLKICTIGRIGFQKNPSLFNQIAEKFPNIQFTWIGEGELKEQLTSKNITVTGWLKREEVLQKVAEHDIFILTSLWEGLPIALLEAMYLKKVCIVTNVIGNRDVIKNDVNGFVCNTLEEFEKVINKIQNENVSEKLIENAKNDVVKNYNIKIMSEKYLELYK